MAASVLCVGHACWDLSFYADEYPAENSKLETDLLLESGGGPAANAAWLLARWGVPTALGALMGEDGFGARALAELQEAGVNCELVELRAGHVTPVSSILINRANGSRTICNRKRAGQWGLPMRAPAGADPAFLLFDGHEPAASLEALRAFPSAISVLDAGSLREGTRLLAPRVNYLIGSQRFAAQVLGASFRLGAPLEAACRLRAVYGVAAAVTLGEKGVSFDDGREAGWIPALPVAPQDTTAAGDIFHGAFVYGLRKEMGFEAALRLGNTAAGLSVQRRGGRRSTPELSEVLEAMRHG